MKKVSTAVKKQDRNVSQPTLTIGLDLGDRNSWPCVLDEAGQIQVEQRVRTTGKALGEAFVGIPRSRIALEIGMHSPWVSRVLSELGHEVIVANARKVRLIGESRKKDDRLDAQTLARLARIDPQLLLSGEASQCGSTSGPDDDSSSKQVKTEVRLEVRGLQRQRVVQTASRNSDRCGRRGTALHSEAIHEFRLCRKGERDCLYLSHRD